MKSRYLAIFANADGQPQSVMLETNQDHDLPFGAESRVVDALAEKNLDYNDGGVLVLVEMPTAVDFRPGVIDAQANEEISMTFIDL